VGQAKGMIVVAPLVISGILAAFIGFELGGAFAGISLIVAALTGIALAIRLSTEGGKDERPFYERLGTWLLIALPGLLTVYLGFQSGGYFPDAYSLAAFLLTIALAARFALARDPFASFSRASAVVMAALLFYGAWALVSAAWSDAPARSILEASRILLYLLSFALLASLPRTDSRVRWLVRGVALGAATVCFAGLASRLLPDVLPVARAVANDRLNYPLSYWNALGVLSSIAIVLCLHHASDERETWLARVLGAAAVPGLAATLLFTFSRGAIAALAVGLVVYVVAARPRGLLGGLLAAAPATALAVSIAYGADLLASTEPATRAAADQGHEVGLGILACMAAAGTIRAFLIPLDRRLTSLHLPDERRRPVIASALAAAAVIGLVAVLATGLPGRVSDQYDRFLNTRNTPTSPDVRDRLSSVANTGRLQEWEIATDAFAAAPIEGAGAGTYELQFVRDRVAPRYATDAHSLYLEVLAELGLAGLVLLAVGLITILGSFAANSRGPARPVNAALFAAGATWAIHAGADWDWEMPVTALWLFAAGGLTLARRRQAGKAVPRVRGMPLRLGAALAFAALGLPLALVAVSESKFDNALVAFRDGDCDGAIPAARSSLSAMSLRPEPHELLGYCELQEGRARAAVEDMQAAVDRDPGSWDYHYDLALAQAAAGLDPRRAARLAHRYNPQDPATRSLMRAFATGGRAQWKRRAQRTLVRSELIVEGPRRPGVSRGSP